MVKFIKPLLLVIVIFYHASNLAQISDPLPAPVLPGNLTLRIVDWIQVPVSGASSLPARINLAYHARDLSGRLFVNDQRGLLHVIQNDSITLYLSLYAYLPNALTISSFGNGFHAFTFHPDFASNGKFYTVHMEDPATGLADLMQTEHPDVAVHSVVTEWTADNSADNVFAGTHRELLRIEQPRFAHAIQEIGFNPNALGGHIDYGMLYVAQGDGAVVNTNRPQSLNSPHGSLLRIDPAGTDGGNGQYGIPPQNPFADDNNPATLGEIWAYGLRNPHRFSWDTGGTDKMLIGDIGQDNIEEINLGMIGNNYGWNKREGTFLLDTANIGVVYPLPANDAINNYAYAVAQYDHDEGNAIVGGFVYRGTQIPELIGQYIFGDIVNGRIFYAHIDTLVQGQQALIRELNLVDSNSLPVNLSGLVQGTRVDLRFGLTGTQEIVILTKTDGKIRRLESLSPADSDGDGIFDPVDNCQLIMNSDQRDTNNDGFGNVCDADLDNDNIVNFSDVYLFSQLFQSAGGDADFDGDGSVTFADLFILSTGFLFAPGP